MASVSRPTSGLFDRTRALRKANAVDAEPLMLNICHWKVYVDDDEQPTYRGTLLWHNEGLSIIVNGAPSRR
jgi:hypothetical protein